MNNYRGPRRPRRRSRNNRRNNNNNRRGSRTNYKFDRSMFIKKPSKKLAAKTYEATFQFEELQLHPTLKKNIKYKKFKTPTPIQDKSINHILKGDDLLGIADTGSGKTDAFLIPLVDKVIRGPHKKVLVITPTRELAQQINEELRSLTHSTPVRSVQCIGGCNIKTQIHKLHNKYNFVIGTPGRLRDLSERREINFSGFNAAVIDEVDRMLDMGFINEIKYFLSLLPEQRQNLCFSATVDRKIEAVLDEIFKRDFVKISVKTGETANNVEQDIVQLERGEDKMERLDSLIRGEKFDKVLVFANTKREVDKIDRYLYTKGHKVDAIHGGKRQNRRKRSLDAFKSGRAKVLVATDVAARGLDIDDISHVINYDIPMQYEDYIHRVGRTGRADKSGMALTFVS